MSIRVTSVVRGYVREPFAPQIRAEGSTPPAAPSGAGMFPSADGAVVAATTGGATNWRPPAFNPRTGLLYVNSFDGKGEFCLRHED